MAANARCDEARQQLVVENQRLAYHMVKKFRDRVGNNLKAVGSLDDLYGIAMLSLVKAAASPTYDPARSKFTTYACQAIWNDLSCALRNTNNQIETVSAVDDEGESYIDSIPDDRTPYSESFLDRYFFDSVYPKLSTIQKQILGLWCQRYTLTAIAHKLGLARSTTSKQFNNIWGIIQEAEA